MKALDEYFLMVAFTLLLKRVHVFAKFYLDRDYGSHRAYVFFNNILILRASLLPLFSQFTVWHHRVHAFPSVMRAPKIFHFPLLFPFFLFLLRRRRMAPIEVASSTCDIHCLPVVITTSCIGLRSLEAQIQTNITWLQKTHTHTHTKLARLTVR